MVEKITVLCLRCNNSTVRKDKICPRCASKKKNTKANIIDVAFVRFSKNNNFSKNDFEKKVQSLGFDEYFKTFVEQDYHTNFLPKIAKLEKNKKYSLENIRIVIVNYGLSNTTLDLLLRNYHLFKFQQQFSAFKDYVLKDNKFKELIDNNIQPFVTSSLEIIDLNDSDLTDEEKRHFLKIENPKNALESLLFEFKLYMRIKDEEKLLEYIKASLEWSNKDRYYHTHHILPFHLIYLNLPTR